MRIAISGYYGCGNTGDEAVLSGILDSFRLRAGVGRDAFVALSEDTESTRALHGIAAVPRMSLGAVRRTLRSSDLLISGGGSLIQDATSVRSALYYLGVLRLARLCGTPCILYAQGVGPLRRSVTRRLTCRVVDQVQWVTVRDQGSAALLREIGVRTPEIEVVADPAFALTPEPASAVAQALRDAGITPGPPVIGVALRPWPEHDPGRDNWARMIRSVARKAGARVLFLPMQPPRDTELASRLAAVVPGAGIISDPLPPRTTLGVVGSLSGLVAMRLHALVFGAMAGVPMLAIGYDPKVRALMEMLDEGKRCMNLADFDADEAVRLFESALADGGSLRDRLLVSAAAHRERALVAVDRAMAVAGRRA